MLEKKTDRIDPGIIFIPGNTPSLKNSKVKTSRGIFSSPTVNKYIRKLGIQKFSSSRKEVKGYADPSRPNKFEALRSQFAAMRVGKSDPIFIGYHQVRNSKRLFDFSNSIEIVQDLLTAHDFIEDDNVKFVFPIPMTIDGRIPVEGKIRKEQWYSVDKKNPGVYLKIF
tara:strand:- start:44669 stop:45172 length:504 start_codon:yes stop_codon:yes gene_type:complete